MTTTFRLVADEPREVVLLAPAGAGAAGEPVPVRVIGRRRIEPDETFAVDDRVAGSYAGQPYYAAVDDDPAPARPARNVRREG